MSIPRAPLPLCSVRVPAEKCRRICYTAAQAKGTTPGAFDPHRRAPKKIHKKVDDWPPASWSENCPQCHGRAKSELPSTYSYTARYGTEQYVCRYSVLFPGSLLPPGAPPPLAAAHQPLWLAAYLCRVGMNAGSCVQTVTKVPRYACKRPSTVAGPRYRLHTLRRGPALAARRVTMHQDRLQRWLLCTRWAPSSFPPASSPHDDDAWPCLWSRVRTSV